MIKSTRNKGFHMTFKNGITISVQFGHLNYCSRRNDHPYDSTKFEEMDEMRQLIIESNTAEIAIWDDKGEWFNFGSDTVKGWVNANEIAQWINIASFTTDLKELQELAIKEKIINLK